MQSYKNDLEMNDDIHQSTGKNLPHYLNVYGGNVYGVVLNDSASMSSLSSSFQVAPYKNSPQAPVCYVKPSNTWAGDDSVIHLPIGENSFSLGVSLGVVIGHAASRSHVDRAVGCIEGYILVADLSLPHESYYRPAVREKSFDGSCVIGNQILWFDSPEEIDDVEIDIEVNGVSLSPRHFRSQCRSIEQLIADVSEFMVLQPGDVLLIGVEYQAPEVKTPAYVSLSIKNEESLCFSVSKSREVL